MTQGGVSLAERTSARQDAVTDLFDRHYMAMCRLAYVILGDAALAEEIVMEALLKTYSGWGRLREPHRADLYLRRAVINLCRSRIRRRVAERRAYARLGLGATHQSESVGPETRDVILEAVRALPERQRVCVVLRYFEDLPEAEIADVLTCSIGTVKSQLHKARSNLERSLAPDLEEGDR